MSLYTVLGAKLICEWDSRDASTLFEDDSATDAAEDGDAVAVWKSTSHSAVTANLVQTVSGSRPLYDADVGDGLPGIDFDGSADHMTSAHQSALNLTNAAIAAVITPDSVNTYGGILTKDFAGFSNNYSLTVRGVGSGFWFGPDAYNRTELTYSTTGSRICLFGSFNGDSSQLFLNGTKIVATQTGTNATTSTALYVGRAFNGAFYLNGRIHHLLLMSGLSLDETIHAMAHLMDDWGIAGGPSVPTSGGGVRLVNVRGGADQ
jgi:hypothetical protein